ncbi:chaplin [Streptomyces sp. enrichment culture]|uniref:chaplin n=1 Tax=Streptomyces sp. enrichment culture TaxID=1795815 RepID=UPI003F56BDAE
MRRHSTLVAAALAVVVTLGGAGTAIAAEPDPTATGSASDSPGVASGNLVQLPIDLQANVCGNTIDIIGLLNPAFANHCTST